MALFIGKCLFDGYFIFGFLAVVGGWWGAVVGRWWVGGEGRWSGTGRKKVGFGKTLVKLWENFGNFYN